MSRFPNDGPRNGPEMGAPPEPKVFLISTLGPTPQISDVVNKKSRRRFFAVFGPRASSAPKTELQSRR